NYGDDGSDTELRRKKNKQQESRTSPIQSGRLRWRREFFRRCFVATAQFSAASRRTGLNHRCSRHSSCNGSRKGRARYQSKTHVFELIFFFRRDDLNSSSCGSLKKS